MHFFRPNLSEIHPPTMDPTIIPQKNTVWLIAAKCARPQIRRHWKQKYARFEISKSSARMQNDCFFAYGKFSKTKLHKNQTKQIKYNIIRR